MILVRGAFLSMLSLSVVGAALPLSEPQTGGALAGILAIYLTLTSWMVVRRRHQIGYLEFFALLVALCIVASGVAVGLTASGSSAIVGFLLGGIAAIAAGGDLRLLLLGAIRERQRMARHLWRLGVALLIATATLAAARGSLVYVMVEVAVLMSLILWIIYLQVAGTGR